MSVPRWVRDAAVERERRMAHRWWEGEAPDEFVIDDGERWEPGVLYMPECFRGVEASLTAHRWWEGEALEGEVRS